MAPWLVRLRPIFLIVGVTFVSSIAVVWPNRQPPIPAWSFWDGPSYLTIAREGYFPRPGNPLAPDPNRPPQYLSHLPAYPLSVRALSFIGETRALFLAAWLAAAGAAVLFYLLCRDVWGIASPFWVTMAFLFLPPRWIMYRSLPASEPLFLLFALLAIWLFEKHRWLLGILVSCGAALTRWNGVVMAAAWAFVLWRRDQWRRILWLAVLPLSVLLFMLYVSRPFRDWQAPVEMHLEVIGSIRILGDVTNFQYWHQNINAELILLLLLLSTIGLWKIRRLEVPVAYALTQLLFLLLIYGRDWPRYALAFTPMLIALALKDVWIDRRTRWILLPAAVLGMIWAHHAIPFNVMKDPGALLQYLRIAG